MNRCLAAVVLVAIGCGGHHHHHDDHDDEQAVAATVWGRHAELFAEWSPLVAGAPSNTAIHVTRLADFAPVTAGSVSVTLRQSDGSVVSGSAGAPAKPGIFTPSLSPTVAGSCTMTIDVRGDGWSEQLTSPACEVHAEPPPPTPHDESGAISFSKEQQWNAEFATIVATERPMRRVVRVNAEIKPVAGQEAHLTAAVGGRVQFADDAPVIGMPIKKGQLLATVTPPLTGATNRATLEAEHAAAKAELLTARNDEERVARLIAEDAVPKRRVQEAAARVSVAESRARAARERLREYDASASGRGRSGNAFRVRSPIAGTLVKVDITSGETVASGAHLFSVIDLEKVWVEGRVFEPDIPAVIGAQRAVFSVEGYRKPFMIDETNGRLIALGQVLDPHTRTVPVVFEVTNRDALLRIGQFAELEIAGGESVPALAVPAGAVQTDGGRSVVFVQTGGESFERRFVKTGVESGGWIAIETGVARNERVVSRGAHDVKLASAATAAPGHGHAH